MSLRFWHWWVTVKLRWHPVPWFDLPYWLIIGTPIPFHHHHELHANATYGGHACFQLPWILFVTIVSYTVMNSYPCLPTHFLRHFSRICACWPVRICVCWPVGDLGMSRSWARRRWPWLDCCSGRVLQQNWCLHEDDVIKVSPTNKLYYTFIRTEKTRGGEGMKCRCNERKSVVYYKR
jgi:hypothetical protein